jgi:hypothetical protein
MQEYVRDEKSEINNQAFSQFSQGLKLEVTEIISLLHSLINNICCFFPLVLYYSDQATMTKYHKLSNLKNKYLLPHCSGEWNYEN